MNRRVPLRSSGLLLRSAPCWCSVERAKAAADVGENISPSELFLSQLSDILAVARIGDTVGATFFKESVVISVAELIKESLYPNSASIFQTLSRCR
jgi:hypothetical protein